MNIVTSIILIVGAIAIAVAASSWTGSGNPLTRKSAPPRDTKKR